MPAGSHQARYRRRHGKWLQVNAEYAKVWPNIGQKGDAPADAKDWEGKPDKFEKFFDPKPGSGS